MIAFEAFASFALLRQAGLRRLGAGAFRILRRTAWRRLSLRSSAHSFAVSLGFLGVRAARFAVEVGVRRPAGCRRRAGTPEIAEQQRPERSPGRSAGCGPGGARCRFEEEEQRRREEDVAEPGCSPESETRCCCRGLPAGPRSSRRRRSSSQEDEAEQGEQRADQRGDPDPPIQRFSQARTPLLPLSTPSSPARGSRTGAARPRSPRRSSAGRPRGCRCARRCRRG